MAWRKHRRTELSGREAAICLFAVLGVTAVLLVGCGTSQQPEANAGGPYVGSVGSQISFDGSKSTAQGGQTPTFAWNFGDSATGTGVNPTHSYNAAGSYTVTLTITDSVGRTGTATAKATISALPVANAGGPYSANLGQVINFDGSKSTAASGLTLTGYVWTFGDGGTGTGVNPTHTYATAGPYTATLTVTDSAGGTGRAPSSVTIIPLPVANAGGPYTGTVGQAVNFDGSKSTAPSGLTLTGYAWTFGDGGTGTGVDPTYTYTAAGPYTATLAVTDSAGGTGSAPSPVTIIPPPEANAGGPYTGTVGQAVSFDGSKSTAPSGQTLTGYSWSFGDGGTGTGVNPTHTYTTAGPYTVTLTVTDSIAGTGSAPSAATISAPPVANAGGPYTGTVGQPVSFDGSKSTAPSGQTLTAYSWAFGDGSTGTGVTPTHTYATAGPYTVTLTVTDSMAGTGTATAPATIIPPPAANPGGPYTGTVGQPVSFDSSKSTAPSGQTLKGYTWTFGDGGTATGVNPMHTYATAGPYTVTLTVTDSVGGTGTGSSPATISAPPVANAGGPYTGTVGQAVSFDGSKSTAPSGQTLTGYAWTFGDGGTATGVNPTHTYTTAGPYTVTLTVTDSVGGAGNGSSPATISTPPVANAGGPYTGIVGQDVTFDGSKSTPPGCQYTWNFGDGGTGMGVNPLHTYTSVGTYTATLTLTCSGGATVAATATVAILPIPVVVSSVLVTCNPASVQPTQTSQCTATVAGTGSYASGVTWAADAGTVSAAGLYTAPTAVPSAGAANVKATSTQDPTKSGSAVVTISSPMISATAVVPASVPLGTATTITITSVIADTSVVAGSVSLLRLDSAGRVIATVGTLHDDGLNGDSIANDGTFTLQAVLTEFAVGPISFQISASFPDSTSHVFSPVFTVTVIGTPPPSVAIISPGNLTYLSLSPTTVSGTVDDPNATIQINSISVPNANGAFTASIPLAEGPNILTVTATSASGAVGAASEQVTLDTTPPHVTVTSPMDKFVTSDAAISVAGNVNDIVVGTVNNQQAQVTVNGIASEVANRTFLATSVPLNMGSNTIQVVAVDRAGNSATTQITVVRQVPQPGQIRTISGNNQTATIGSALSTPLTIALTDSAGNPAPNKSVIFAVTQNNGMLSTGGGTLAATVMATTDAKGQAMATWMLGMRSGAGSDGVQAYSVGSGGTAIFTATATPGTPGLIVIDTGNNQTGAVNQALPKPLLAVVVDAGHNRLAGVPVTFTVQQGDGSFAGQPSLTVTTDPDGRAAATLTLGFQEGNSNNLVTADFAGDTAFPASFTASGLGPGDPAKTEISGLVLDNSEQPIAGVTIHALLTNVLNANMTAANTAPMATSDANGKFTISQAPIGYVKLLVDGTTAPGTYPTLEYEMVTVAGQVNTVGGSIYLLPIKTNNRLCVTDTTGGGTLTIPEAPGFSLTFGPGQVTFPGGSKTGCVSVTSVHPDKIPMTPGFGQQPRFIVTIQPSGALFNPPAPITLPNVDGLKPREVTEMYSYDHDISSFVAIGTGTVSDDGQVIRSNTGVGVLKAGWHCGGDPNANGTVADCPDCRKCQGNACIPDDTRSCDDGKFCTSCTGGLNVGPDCCKFGRCSGSPIEEVQTTAALDLATYHELESTIDSLFEEAVGGSSWCWAARAVPSVSLQTEQGTFCCEKEKALAFGSRVTGSLSISTSGSCFLGMSSFFDLPPAFLNFVGLQASGAITATESLSDVINSCKSPQWQELASLNLSVGGTANIINAGDGLLSVTLGKAALVSGALTGTCDNFFSNCTFSGKTCLDNTITLNATFIGIKFQALVGHLPFTPYCF